MFNTYGCLLIMESKIKEKFQEKSKPFKITLEPYGTLKNLQEPDFHFWTKIIP